MYKITLCAVLLGMISQANAGIINYDESLDGDLNNRQHFIFDSGVNTISGSVTWAYDIFSSDFDHFSFSLEKGFTLTSVYVDVELQDVGNGLWQHMGWGLNGTQETTSTSAHTNLFSNILPIDEGSYLFEQNSASGRLGQGDYRIADYTLKFTVASVPEPTSLLLLGLGLGVLGLSRKLS